MRWTAFPKNVKGCVNLAWNIGGSVLSLWETDRNNALNAKESTTLWHNIDKNTGWNVVVKPWISFQRVKKTTTTISDIFSIDVAANFKRQNHHNMAQVHGAV